MFDRYNEEYKKHVESMPKGWYPFILILTPLISLGFIALCYFATSIPAQIQATQSIPMNYTIPRIVPKEHAAIESLPVEPIKQKGELIQVRAVVMPESAPISDADRELGEWYCNHAKQFPENYKVELYCK